MRKTFTPAKSKGFGASCLLLVLCMLFAARLAATTITVNSITDLQTAINNAQPGDIIILANGVYTTTTDITVSKKGTAAQPITIAAQTIGGAEITGAGGFSIVSPAAYIIIKGFKFTHAADHAKMASGTSFCRWTRNIFETPGEGEYLLLNGNDHEVDYNTFQNKHNLGRFIAVRGTGSQIAQRLWIHHNYFYQQFPGGGNGAETLQFGLSGYSLSNSNSIIEYNLFELCDGENELISVKASQLTIRYNTIRNCPAQFTLRHGNRSIVYGNYFINTPGLRIFGDDHIIHSNHFENCNPAVDIGNGDGEVADGAPLTSHDRPDRVFIGFNTLVNNPVNFHQGGRTGGLGATFITVANNIVQGGGAAASIAGPYVSPTWQGNIIFNTSGPGSMPDSGYINTDPRLARDLTGTFHLQPGSPAIDAVNTAYPSVTTDMDGQPRSLPLDKGADEVSSAPVTAHILSPNEVGATAAGDVPVINLTAPANGAVLDGGSTVSITADALSFNDTISHVDFYIDSTKIGTDSVAPYGLSWLATEGVHTLSAKAIDNKGAESDATAAVVTVNPAGMYTSIASPANGASFVAPAGITINVNASDSTGSISKVEFFNGSTKLGEDLTSPYSFSWTNVAAGNYTLQAKSTDNNGKTSLSVPVRITVAAAPATSFDITDNGGTIAAQYPNTSKPTEDVPSLIDNNKSTKYYRSGKNVLWVQYKSTVPAIVVKYTITSANDVPGRDPRDWNLQGSNDGTNWTTLDSRAGESFAARLQTNTYTFTDTTAYVYFRLNITNNAAGAASTGTQFAEWEMFERRTQTITFDSISNKTYGDDPFTLNASVNSGLPVTLQVVDGPASLVDSVLTITGAGVVTVRASQPGNDNYFPAADVIRQFTVNKADQTIAFDAIDNKTYGDAPFSITAVSDAGLPVTFEVVSGPAQISGDSVIITGAGSVTIRAVQAGNENYNPANAGQSFVVNKSSQTISFAAIAPQSKRDTVLLTATASSGLPVSYTVVSGPGKITGNVLSFTGEGEVIIQANQPGNENYLPADSVQQTVLVYGEDVKKDGIKIKVYPNPTHGVLRVKIEDECNRDYTIMIFDNNGNLVKSAVVRRGSKNYEVSFDLTASANGVFYLYVSDGRYTVVKVIVKR